MAKGKRRKGDQAGRTVTDSSGAGGPLIAAGADQAAPSTGEQDSATTGNAPVERVALMHNAPSAATTSEATITPLPLQRERTAETPAVILPPEDLSEEAGGARFGIGSYLLMNALFIAFCLVQMAIFYIWLRETRGLFFFFGLLIVAFALASVFDYVYDRLSAHEDQNPVETEV